MITPCWYWQFVGVVLEKFHLKASTSLTAWKHSVLKMQPRWTITVWVETLPVALPFFQTGFSAPKKKKKTEWALIINWKLKDIKPSRLVFKKPKYHNWLWYRNIDFLPIWLYISQRTKHPLLTLKSFSVHHKVPSSVPSPFLQCCLNCQMTLIIQQCNTTWTATFCTTMLCVVFFSSEWVSEQFQTQLKCWMDFSINI